MRKLSTDLDKLKKRLLTACGPASAPLDAWPLVCGERIASQTKALIFSDKVLRVLVPTAGWQRELSALSTDYLRRLNELLPGAVERIEFLTPEAVGKKQG